MHTLDWNVYLQTARRAAADGIVMLRNEHAALPLLPGTRISLFGRSQMNYYKSGTGSGGMVNVQRVIGIREALEEETALLLNKDLADVYAEWDRAHAPKNQEGWGNEPWSQEEMPLSEELASEASKVSDAAVCVIARTAGEDRDNSPAAGSFCLTETELDMLCTVRSAFDRMIVLLNVGNIIDMSFVDACHPDAVLYVWQGGMIGGLGVADVLTGRVSPSGHLTDTIAYALEDYPSTENFGCGDEDIYQEDIYVGYRFFESAAKEKVMYPFGYGLSYTTFEFRTEHVRTESDPQAILFETAVHNTGKASGRAVVQVYVRCPQGALGKPLRQLADYQKTTLLKPGEKQTISFRIPFDRFASYDDGGLTGHADCWVLEKGRYDLFVGENVRDAVCVTPDTGAFTLGDTVVTSCAEQACAPIRHFQKMTMRTVTEAENGIDPKLQIIYTNVPLQTVDVPARIRYNLPEEKVHTAGTTWKLSDVVKSSCTLDAFTAQLSDRALCQIVRGEGMSSSLVTPGTASAFGGVSPELQELEIPAICCDDGPSGMRLDCGDHAFSLPNGTLLACTFDRELNRELFSLVGLEMLKNHVECLLGPGINIHRNPLNGRNFEYFSEDPYLTGTIAAAQIRGLQERGVTGVLKHFAANNRETKRHSLDSVMSQRALREIYLRGFEIACREGGANAVMTSYGKLNGIYTASRYDLTTTILRKEWGFDGIVMTDWWANFSPAEIIEDPSGKHAPVDQETTGYQMMRGCVYDFSTMVRAQNDLYMCVPDGRQIGIPKAECAENGEEGHPAEETAGMGLTADLRCLETTEDAVREGRLTRAELQRSAVNILKFVMNSAAMKRLMGEEIPVSILNAPADEDLEVTRNVDFLPVPKEGLTVDLSGMSCISGKDEVLGFQMEAGTEYRLTFDGVCNVSPLAQIPVTLLYTSIPIHTMIWNGTGEEVVSKEITVGAPKGKCLFRLHFAQTGLRLKRLYIEKI